MVPTLVKIGNEWFARKSAMGVIPFSLLANQPNNSFVLPANGSGTIYMATNSGDGPLVISKTAIQATGAASVRFEITDAGEWRPLMNTDCHVSTIFGDGAKPYYWPEALLIEPAGAFNMYFTELSGSNNTIWPVFHGYQALQYKNQVLQKHLRFRRIETPFWYTFSNGKSTLSGNGTNNETIEVKIEHDFAIHQISAVSDGAFAIDIIDQARGISMISAPSNAHYPVDSRLLMGNANFPYKLIDPVMIRAGQRILLTLTDLSGLANNVYVTLGGVAVWRV